jgi:hypothetical protein
MQVSYEVYLHSKVPMKLSSFYLFYNFSSRRGKGKRKGYRGVKKIQVCCIYVY